MVYAIGMADTGAGSKLRRGKIPHRVRVAVMERSDWRCVGCGSHRDVQIDHIKPWSQGGSDEPDNLQALCRGCNIDKGPRPTPARIRRQMGERRVILSVRLSLQGIAALDQLAAERNQTRSEAFRLCLGMGLAALGFTPAQIAQSIGTDGRKKQDEGVAA